MQPFNDDAGPTEAKEATPYAPPEPTHSLLNIGAILSVVAVVLATVGSILPFISLPGDVFQNGAPSSVLQFLSRALYSSFLNALPTVWFFAMVIIAAITIASIAGVHFRVLYVGQVTLSVFAIFWGFMTMLMVGSADTSHDELVIAWLCVLTAFCAIIRSEKSSR